MSLLFAFVFFGAFCARCGSIDFEGDYAVYFPNKGVTDYVIIKYMPSLTHYTVCFWMKSTEKSSGDNETSLFSYATSNAPWGNELYIKAHNGIQVHIQYMYYTVTGVSITDGKWHHVCTSWSNSDGSWKIYKDGKLVSSGTGFQQGYIIQGGGVVVLGQDQDSLGGGFDSNQSLQGYLANVNVWSHVLSADTIMKMSKSCLQGEGDVYKWSDFKCGVRGNTEVFIPSPCKPMEG